MTATGRPQGQDLLSRIVCDPLNLRAYTVNSINTVREITGLHKTTPNATVALGRTLTAAALLSATLKPGSDQSLLLKVEGTGPIREIHAQADARGNIRGYASNPKVDLTEDIGDISFSRTIGAGFLTVRKDFGHGEPYSSVIPLQAGDLAIDIAYYLSVSEQVPSALILALTLNREGAVTTSGGILIQTYPDTTEEVIRKIENNINGMSPSLSESLRAGHDIHAVLADLFESEPMHILDAQPIRASCRCSKQVLGGVLSAMSLHDLIDMQTKENGAEITCTFCGRQYHFDARELERIIQKKNRSSPAR